MKTDKTIPTAHIKAEAGQIAKVVIMPGDPLRAKYVANISENQIAAVGTIYETINQTAKKFDDNLNNKTKEANVLTEKINLKHGLIHSSDVFYRANQDKINEEPMIAKCLAVEME